MGKHVVIGISGGIAAYKTMFLIRLFKRNGYEVKVVATKNVAVRDAAHDRDALSKQALLRHVRPEQDT